MVRRLPMAGAVRSSQELLKDRLALAFENDGSEDRNAVLMSSIDPGCWVKVKETRDIDETKL